MTRVDCVAICGCSHCQTVWEYKIILQDTLSDDKLIEHILSDNQPVEHYIMCPSNKTYKEACRSDEWFL